MSTVHQKMINPGTLTTSAHAPEELHATRRFVAGMLPPDGELAFLMTAYVGNDGGPSNHGPVPASAASRVA